MSEKPTWTPAPTDWSNMGGAKFTHAVVYREPGGWWDRLLVRLGLRKTVVGAFVFSENVEQVDADTFKLTLAKPLPSPPEV